MVRRLGPEVRRGPNLVFWPGEALVIQNHWIGVSGREILIQEKKKKLETKNKGN